MSQTVRKEKEYDSLCDEILDRRRTDFTPDYLELKNGEHLVFLYNRLRSGGTDFTFMQDVKSLGRAVSFSSDYKMYKFKGPFGVEQPAVFRLQKGNKFQTPYKGHMFGEVFVVDIKRLMKLDEYHQNTFAYTRQESKTWVRLVDQNYVDKDGKKKNPYQQVFCYFGVEDTLQNFLEGVVPAVKLFDKWCHAWRQTLPQESSGPNPF